MGPRNATCLNKSSEDHMPYFAKYPHRIAEKAIADKKVNFMFHHIFLYSSFLQSSYKVSYKKAESAPDTKDVEKANNNSAKRNSQNHVPDANIDRHKKYIILAITSTFFLPTISAK